MKAAAALIALWPAVAPACDLALILAIDVSGSIDAREYAVQTAGLAEAFETPVMAAAVASLPGGILSTVTHWSGSSRQQQVTGWYRLTDAASLSDYAAAIRATPRSWRNYSTAIGEALAHAERIGDTLPEPCSRRVIDVSGDGVSNEGQPPRPVSDRLATRGYVVNGLVIRGADPDPVAHFLAEVIAGEGAFVDIAEGFDDYPRAILRKLLREIDRPLAVSHNDLP